MIVFPDKAIPVVTPLGDGYVLYVKDNGQFEDDEWCCVLDKDGAVKHFLSGQIKIWHNATYNINKHEKTPIPRSDRYKRDSTWTDDLI